MKKTILVGIILFLSVLIIQPTSELTEDGIYHFPKILGKCDEITWIACETYPPLYHIIAGFFVNSEQTFYIFNLIIVLLIFPIVLEYFTKIKNTGLFYLLFTNISFLTLDLYFMPQIMMMMLWVIFLFQKNPIIRITIFIASIFTHNAGWLLIGITFIAELMRPHIENLIDNLTLKVLPITIPVTFDIKNFAGHPEWHLGFYFINIFPLALIVGIFEIIKQKKYDWMIIGFASLIWSFEIARAFLPLILLTTITFTQFYAKQNKKMKMAIIGFGLISISLNFFFYFIKYIAF